MGWPSTPANDVTIEMCRAMFDASRIDSEVIFNRNEDGLTRLIQLVGARLTHDDILGSLVVNRRGTRFTELLVNRSAAGHNIIDGYLLRAACCRAIADDEYVAAQRRDRMTPCSLCDVCPGKAFNADIKVAREYYRGCYVLGGVGKHVDDAASFKDALQGWCRYGYWARGRDGHPRGRHTPRE